MAAEPVRVWRRITRAQGSTWENTARIVVDQARGRFSATGAGSVGGTPAFQELQREFTQWADSVKPETIKDEAALDELLRQEGRFEKRRLDLASAPLTRPHDEGPRTSPWVIAGVVVGVFGLLANLGRNSR